jgi:hypothetical protein
MCDVVSCYKLDNPYKINLIQYKKTVSKPVHSQGINGNLTLPVYEQFPLEGDIKLEVIYYTDAQCKNKQIYTETIKN